MGLSLCAKGREPQPAGRRKESETRRSNSSPFRRARSARLSRLLCSSRVTNHGSQVTDSRLSNRASGGFEFAATPSKHSFALISDRGYLRNIAACPACTVPGLWHSARKHSLGSLHHDFSSFYRVSRKQQLCSAPASQKFAVESSLRRGMGHARLYDKFPRASLLGNPLSRIALRHVTRHWPRDSVSHLCSGD